MIHQRFRPQFSLLPHLFEEMIIVLGATLACAVYVLYRGLGIERVPPSEVAASIISPSFFADTLHIYDWGSKISNIMVWCFYAVVGTLIYCCFYMLANIYIEIHNEALLDKFTHPTKVWHHWGRFFAVESARFVLGLLVIAWGLLLVVAIFPNMLNRAEFVILGNGRAMDLVFAYVAFVFSLNLLTIAIKVLRSLRAQ